MTNDKKELQVAALENGTVIDHIPAEKLFTVVSLLGLEHMSNNITIGFNLNSKKLGKKGIIKIADKFFCDDEINRIAVVAPNVKLNIIRNYEVVEKRELRLPDELHGIVKCANPKCITNNEPGRILRYCKWVNEALPRNVLMCQCANALQRENTLSQTQRSPISTLAHLSH